MRCFALYDREFEKLVETKLTRRFNVNKFEKYYRMRFFDDYLISFRRGSGKQAADSVCCADCSKRWKKYSNYVRIAFTLNSDLLNTAMKRISEFL